MKNLIFLAAFLMIGCRGVDRIVNGSTDEGIQSNQYYSSSKPYENDPDFSVVSSDGTELRKYVGKYADKVNIESNKLMVLRVMIRNHGFWFEIGPNQPNLTAPCYEYLNGVIKFKNIVSFEQYCIYGEYTI